MKAVHAPTHSSIARKTKAKKNINAGVKVRANASTQSKANRLAMSSLSLCIAVACNGVSGMVTIGLSIGSLLSCCCLGLTLLFIKGINKLAIKTNTKNDLSKKDIFIIMLQYYAEKVSSDDVFFKDKASTPVDNVRPKISLYKIPLALKNQGNK